MKSKNKTYTVTKPMTVTFKETGIKENYNIVKDAIENIQNEMITKGFDCK